MCQTTAAERVYLKMKARSIVLIDIVAESKAINERIKRFFKDSILLKTICFLAG